MIKSYETETIEITPKEKPKPLQRKLSEEEINKAIKESNELNKKKGFNVYSMKRSTYVIMWFFIIILIIFLLIFGIWFNISYQNKQYGSNITLNTPINIENINQNNITSNNPINLNITLDINKLIIDEVANEILRKINNTNSTS